MVSKKFISEALSVMAIIFTLYGFWFILLIILWFNYKLWMATRRIEGHQLEPETAHLPAARGVQQRLLETNVEIVFDTCMIGENSNEPSGGGCAICLEEHKYGETRAARTACDHWFHASCIMSWLSENDTCPLCRNSLI